MLKYVFVVLTVMLIALVAPFSGGRYAWQRDTEQRRQVLLTAKAVPSQRIDLKKTLVVTPLRAQPHPRRVLPSNPLGIRSMPMRHKGKYNLSEAAANWRAFISDQWVNAQSTGFDWNAKIAYLPSLSVYVHDSYLQKDGSLHAGLAGCLTLARTSCTPEIAQGELIRCFAEASWYPMALLPSAKVSWQAVDEHNPLLVARDGSYEIRLQFHFNLKAFAKRQSDWSGQLGTICYAKS